jgi:hypothetical protein
MFTAARVFMAGVTQKLFLRWAIVLLLSINTSAECQSTNRTSPYAYNGGSFSVTATFKAFTSYEFDGSAGGDVGSLGWIVVSNLATGKSASFPYLQALQLPQAASGSATSGMDISGTVTINGDELGTGPLTFEVLGVTVAYPPLGGSHIKSVYGNYLNTTLVPLNVQVGLPPYQSNNVSTSPPGTPVRSGGSGSNPSTNIHAVIISGLSDPTKVISSPNVTVTGGIVALGKDDSPPSLSSSWSPGLRIVPDYGLLTGEKIPPVTPNILDVRIVRQEVTADFRSPNPQPSN